AKPVAPEDRLKVRIFDDAERGQHDERGKEESSEDVAAPSEEKRDQTQPGGGSAVALRIGQIRQESDAGHCGKSDQRGIVPSFVQVKPKKGRQAKEDPQVRAPEQATRSPDHWPNENDGERYIRRA